MEKPKQQIAAKVLPSQRRLCLLRRCHCHLACRPGHWMELLFDDLIHTHQPACLAVARFSAPVLVTQLRVTSLDQQQQQQQPERPLQLLVHSMPSTSRPYAHFDSFTLSLAASSERTQVFDLPISPEHTTPARLMVFRGPWEGLQVQVYGFIQKKKRAAAAPASTSESAHSGNLKRVKLEDPSHVTPVASTSQDSQGEQQRPRRLQVPDWKGIQDLLQLHRQRRGASQRSQTAHRDVLDAAREAWREQSRDETALEHADMLALWRKTSDITVSLTRGPGSKRHAPAEEDEVGVPQIPASVQKALAQLAQATAKPTLDSQSDVVGDKGAQQRRMQGNNRADQRPLVPGYRGVFCFGCRRTIESKKGRPPTAPSNRARLSLPWRAHRPACPAVRARPASSPAGSHKPPLQPADLYGPHRHPCPPLRAR